MVFIYVYDRVSCIVEEMMLKFHFLNPVSIYKRSFGSSISLSCFTMGKMDIHGTTDKGKFCVCIIYTRKPFPAPSF